jgi:hypothetical protein
VTRRLAVAAAVVVAATLAPPRQADASPRQRFTICATVSATSPRCYNGGVTYEVGQTVYLRGRITPAHPGFGQVLRRAPSSQRMRVVGTMGVAADGRIRWSWPTRARDVDGGEPHLFAFRIPDVGRSHLVEVWVVPRHG